MKKLITFIAISLITISAFSQYKLNTYYPELGGYVIELSDMGKHGLVVAQEDQGKRTFNDSLELVADSSLGDFNDWRLPTICELNLMYDFYKNGNQVQLNANDYWSSTKVKNGAAFYKNFRNGESWGELENNAIGYIRAVRNF